MNAAKARGAYMKPAPKVKNGYFTFGIRKCSKCKGTTKCGGHGVMYGTYEYNGEQVCRACAKKYKVI